MNKRKIPTKKEALLLASKLKKKLERQKIPVRNVFLFGSVAKGTSHEWSDIDIAIICDPFKPSKLDEIMTIRKARRTIDTRIEPICLHYDQMEDRFSTIVQEVKKYGIPIK